MTNFTKTLAKGALGTVAAGAMALAGATPAMAEHDRDRGIDAGDVIAGAVIIGGIAAIAGALGNDDDRRYRDRRYGDRYGDYRYNRNYISGERAVERCVRAAEREARRYGYRYANVTHIRDVDRTRHGFKVKGNIVVDGNHNYGYRDRYDRYDRYNRYERRGADRGKFQCYVDGRGRPQVDFRGIRGLH